MLLTIGALLYILSALREARFLGAKMFFENLVRRFKIFLALINLFLLQSTAPSRVMFLFSCILMLTIPFMKFFCLPELEDHIAVAIMLTTSPYFLFFCR